MSHIEKEEMEALLKQLNESQQRAVTYCDGPSLVIAGAGSGKTRVLTYKIAYLLQMGMKPWNILALTFTNKAAQEMKTRIGQLVGDTVARRLVMGTFHSIFSRILRAEASRIGFTNNFTIYDESDSRSLLKSIVKDLQLDDKVYKPATVHHRISMAKNHLVMSADYALNRSLLERDRTQGLSAISQIFTAYEARLRQANAMDFDDLLTHTYRLFQSHDDVRSQYAERFQYVLVDEYQDTNSVQQRIVIQLTGAHQHVCVVGDDAQSIYGFRGANIDNILDFQTVFPRCRLFKLEQNYRSTQRIVQAANSLIKKNERQIPKDVFSMGDKGDCLTLKHAYSDKEEAIIVCKDIKRMKRTEHLDWADFAILYRTNAQSRPFEDEMLKQDIPYRIYGGLSFYQRKEIKDVIAYFRLVANPDDEEALKRVINYPARGIGDTTLQKVSAAATAAGVSLWSVISNSAGHALDINKGTATKLLRFTTLIQSFRQRLASSDACQLGTAIIQEAGISADLYSESSPEALNRQENLQEFLGSLSAFVDERIQEGRADQVALTDFLQEVSLMTDLDSEGSQEGNRVNLMTVHSAKGLEFPVVFVVGLEENIFPSSMSLDSKRQLEEERRLLYVAITRAERHCVLTCAKNRWRYGKMEFGTPSRFLRDIDPRLLHEEGNEAPTLGTFSGYGSDSRMHYQNSRPVASQFKADPLPRLVPHRDDAPSDPLSPRLRQALSASSGRLRRVADVVPPPASSPYATSAPQGPAGRQVAVGNVIEHERFGIGSVEKVEGSGENTKATVNFRHAGVKQLLLKFARFKVVG